MCIDKNTSGKSTKFNYKDFGVIPGNLLYKKFVIIFVMKKLPKSNNINSIHNRIYNISINYTSKNTGQRFIDYLRPTFFSSMPFNINKTMRSNHKLNHKITVSYWLLQEL